MFAGQRLIGFGGTTESGTADAVITFRDSVDGGGSSSSYTPTMATGTGTRHVIVTIGAQGSSQLADPTTVSVGGQSCTKLVGGGGVLYEDIWIYITSVAISSTSSQTITISWAVAPLQAQFGIHSVSDLQSITPTATVADSSIPLSQSITVSAGGVLLMGACIANGSSSFGAPTGVDDDWDRSNAGGLTSSGGGHSYATLQSGMTVAAAPVGSTRPSMRAVALR